MEEVVKYDELEKFKVEIAQIKGIADGIVVQSIDDKIPIEQAKSLLKQTKKALTAVENKRVELKDFYLKTGQKIDKVAKEIRLELESLESGLTTKANYEAIYKKEMFNKEVERRRKAIMDNKLTIAFDPGSYLMSIPDDEFDEFIADSIVQMRRETEMQERLGNRMMIAGELQDFMSVNLKECTDEEFSEDLIKANNLKLAADWEFILAERYKRFQSLHVDFAHYRDIEELPVEEFESYFVEVEKILRNMIDFRVSVKVICEGRTELYPKEYNYISLFFYHLHGDGSEILKELAVTVANKKQEERADKLEATGKRREKQIEEFIGFITPSDLNLIRTATFTDEEWNAFISEKSGMKLRAEVLSDNQKAEVWISQLKALPVPEFATPRLTDNVNELINKIVIYVKGKTQV